MPKDINCTNTSDNKFSGFIDIFDNNCSILLEISQAFLSFLIKSFKSLIKEPNVCIGLNSANLPLSHISGCCIAQS